MRGGHYDSEWRSWLPTASIALSAICFSWFCDIEYLLLKRVFLAFVAGGVASLVALLFLLGSCGSIAKISNPSGRMTVDDDALARSKLRPLLSSPAVFRTEVHHLEQAQTFRNTQHVYPASFLISQNIGNLVDALLQRFVSSWYESQVTTDTTFVLTIERTLRNAITEFVKRLVALDAVDLLVSRIVPRLTCHLQDYAEAERNTRGMRSVKGNLESDDSNVAAKYRDGKLHRAVSIDVSQSRDLQRKYLRRLVSRLLPLLLPADVLESRAARTLIRELVTCAVLAPGMDLLSDPDIWNRVIEASGSSVIQDRRAVRRLRAALSQYADNPDPESALYSFPRLTEYSDARAFERFIRSIHQCTNLKDMQRLSNEVKLQLKRESGHDQGEVYLRRLETGLRLMEQKIARIELAESHRPTTQRTASLDRIQVRASSTKSGTSTVRLREVLYSTHGLSSFLEFMAQRQRMALIQFWIAADGLRDPLSDLMRGNKAPVFDQFGGITTSRKWNESDREDLAAIFNSYLCKSELKVPAQVRSTVQQFLDAGDEASTHSYDEALTAVLEFQALVFTELDEKHFPEFRRSESFLEYLKNDQNVNSDTTLPFTTRDGSNLSKSSSIVKFDPQEKGPISTQLGPSTPSVVATPGPSAMAISANGMQASEIESGKILENSESSSRVGGRRPLFDDETDMTPSFPLKVERVLDTKSTDEPRGRQSVLHCQGQGSIRLSQSAHSFQRPRYDQDRANTYRNVRSPLRSSLYREDEAGESKDNVIYQDNREVDLMPKSLSSSFVAQDDLQTGSKQLETDADQAPRRREQPNLASLGLVNTSSRIGVFSDDDLFNDDEQFLEDELPDEDESSHGSVSDIEDIHEAAPGDLELHEVISALNMEIDRLLSQQTLAESMIRKAELTNSLADLRILRKSKASLQREIQRKEIQRSQYVVQENENSLQNRTEARISSVKVGHDHKGQEYALYVIQVHRHGNDVVSDASWLVSKRYREFHSLHLRLRSSYTAVRRLDFPRRRLVTKLQSDVIKRRRRALQQYLAALLAMPDVCRSRVLRAFLSQPDSSNRQSLPSAYQPVISAVDESIATDSVAREQVEIMEKSSLSNDQRRDRTSMQQPTDTDEAINKIVKAPGSLSQSTSQNGISSGIDAVTTPSVQDVRTTMYDQTLNTYPSQSEPFVKPISRLFLEVFDLRRGNNWLRGRAVTIVLQQIMGGAVERRIRESVHSFLSEDAVLQYLSWLQALLCPQAVEQDDVGFHQAVNDSKHDRVHQGSDERNHDRPALGQRSQTNVERNAATMPRISAEPSGPNRTNQTKKTQSQGADKIGRNNIHDFAMAEKTSPLLPTSDASRTAKDKAKTRFAASATLSTLLPDIFGNVVGRANAENAAGRLAAVFNNKILNQHLIYTILDEMVEICFPELLASE